MATQPILTVPDPRTQIIDPATGLLTQEGYRMVQLIIQKLNKL